MSEARFPRPALAVVKIGSSSLRGGDGRFDRTRVDVLCDQVARLLGGDGDLDRRLSPRGFRMLGTVPRLPLVVIERLGDLSLL